MSTRSALYVNMCLLSLSRLCWHSLNKNRPSLELSWKGSFIFFFLKSHMVFNRGLTVLWDCKEFTEKTLSFVSWLSYSFNFAVFEQVIKVVHIRWIELFESLRVNAVAVCDLIYTWYLEPFNVELRNYWSSIHESRLLVRRVDRQYWFCQSR